MKSKLINPPVPMPQRSYHYTPFLIPDSILGQINASQVVKYTIMCELHGIDFNPVANWPLHAAKKYLFKPCLI